MYSYICIPHDRTTDHSKMLIGSGSRNVDNYMQLFKNKCEPFHTVVLLKGHRLVQL